MGVSQMHLSYLSAKAKLKPLLILIKIHHEATDVSRQLQDFTRVVQQQAKHVYYYGMDTNIEQLLIYAYENMVSNHEVKDGWVRMSEKPEKSNLQRITAQYISPYLPVRLFSEILVSLKTVFLKIVSLLTV